MRDWQATSQSVLERWDRGQRWASRKAWARTRKGVWILLLLFSGCGYRLVTTSIPADLTLALSTFYSPVADATVATAVTRGVREALLSRGWPIVSKEKQPRAELTGRVARYNRVPVALDSKGRAQGYRLSITLAYQLRSGERRLPERQVVGLSEYAVSADARAGQTAERQAVREAARQAGEALADVLPALWPALSKATPSPDPAPSLSPSTAPTP